MRVRVFRNLTSKCLSIQARMPAKGWRTIAHASQVNLSGCVFHVSEAGRQRVIATGKKTVHAWIEGDLMAWHGTTRGDLRAITAAFPDLLSMPRHSFAKAPVPVTYNPRKAATFVTNDAHRHAVKAARWVYLSMDSGVNAAGVVG